MSESQPEQSPAQGSTPEFPPSVREHYGPENLEFASRTTVETLLHEAELLATFVGTAERRAISISPPFIYGQNDETMQATVLDKQLLPEKTNINKAHAYYTLRQKFFNKDTPTPRAYIEFVEPVPKTHELPTANTTETDKLVTTYLVYDSPTDTTKYEPTIYKLSTIGAKPEDYLNDNEFKLAQMSGNLHRVSETDAKTLLQTVQGIAQGYELHKSKMELLQGPMPSYPPTVHERYESEDIVFASKDTVNTLLYETELLMPAEKPGEPKALAIKRKLVGANGEKIEARQYNTSEFPSVSTEHSGAFYTSHPGPENKTVPVPRASIWTKENVPPSYDIKLPADYTGLDRLFTGYLIYDSPVDASVDEPTIYRVTATGTQPPDYVDNQEFEIGRVTGNLHRVSEADAKALLQTVQTATPADQSSV